jgi:DHA2 family multidrug resistance protein-like MFS transporter
MTDQAPAKAGRREWLGLLVLALPCLLYSMDLTVLNLALPSLTEALHPTSTQLLWIVDIYGFTLAGSLITMGTLGDRIGRRKLLMIGGTAFGLASVIAAISNSTMMLIAARALLGVTAATLAPSTLSLLRNMFHDPKERTTAIGIWSVGFSGGAVIGPLVGGILIQHFWWGAPFLVAVPVMVLLLLTGPFLLPEYRDPHAGRPDIPSAVLSVLAIVAVIYGLKQTAQSGFDAAAAASTVVGLVLGVLFVGRQLSLADPLIDLSLFRIPAFAAAVATALFGIFVMFGSLFLVNQFLQLVVGMTPLEAGLATLPFGIAAISSSFIIPIALRQMRPIVAIPAGLVGMSFVFLATSQVTGPESLPLLLTAFTALPIVSGFFFLPVTGLVVGVAPPERAGAAAGISQTSQELGGALGIAVLGSIVIAIYRSTMSTGVLAGLDADAIDGARDTLAAAVGVAATLTPEQSAALLTAARSAFIQGFHLASFVSTAISLALAVMVVVVLRERSNPSISVLEVSEPG